MEKEPESIFEAAESLKRESKNVSELIHKIRIYIENHADSLAETYTPKSIMESRFIPAEEAFEKGITSCGAVTNIAAAMLRFLGYEVKLVHGEWDESVDHAWISVCDKDSGVWKEYDLTTNNEELRSGNMKKAEVTSWEEIRDVITKDHETLRERRIRKGLIKE